MRVRRLIAAVTALALSSALVACSPKPPTNGSKGGERQEQQADAQRLYDTGEFEKAARLLRAAVAKDPDDLSSRRKLALAEAASGKTAAAIAQLEAVVKASPTDHESLFRLALLERASGNAIDAEQHLERAAQASPKTLSYVEELAKTETMLGRPSAAAALWARLLRERSLTPEQRKSYLVQQGEAYLAAGQASSAEKAWKEALQIDPDDTALKERLAGLDER